MDETEVQDVFCRFSQSIPHTPQNAERAELLAQYLWLGLIGGPFLETGIWKTLERLPGMAAEGVEVIRQCYSESMKPAVTSDELKALRKRYDIDPKHPAADIEAVRDRIFREVHLPTRRSTRRALLSRLLVPCGLSGGFYGAAVGSLLASVEASRRGAILGGVPLLIVGVVAGAAYGKFFGAVNRIPFGRLFVGCLGGVIAGLIGVFFGTALPVYSAAAPGFLIGALSGKFVLFRKSPIGGGLGIFLGTGIGMMIGAFQQNREAATAGVLWGMLAGVACGLLVPLILFGSLETLGRMASRKTVPP